MLSREWSTPLTFSSMESPFSLAAASAISSFFTTTDKPQFKRRLSAFQTLLDSSALPWEANTCPGVVSQPRAAHDPISVTAAPKHPRELYPGAFPAGPAVAGLCRSHSPASRSYPGS